MALRSLPSSYTVGLRGVNVNLTMLAATNRRLWHVVHRDGAVVTSDQLPLDSVTAQKKSMALSIDVEPSRPRLDSDRAEVPRDLGGGHGPQPTAEPSRTAGQGDAGLDRATTAIVVRRPGGAPRTALLGRDALDRNTSPTVASRGKTRCVDSADSWQRRPRRAPARRKPLRR